MLRSKPMSPLVIVLLAGLWGWILLPGIVQARRESSPASTVNSFERSMGILAPVRYLPNQRAPVRRAPASPAARAHQRAIRRRRAILTWLSAATAVSGLAGVLIDGAAWTLFAIAGLALACYLSLLLQVSARRLETASKLHRLPERRSVLDLSAELLVTQAVGETGSVRLRRWDH